MRVFQQFCPFLVGRFSVITDLNSNIHEQAPFQNDLALVTAGHWNTQEGAQRKDLSGIDIDGKILCAITRFEAA